MNCEFNTLPVEIQGKIFTYLALKEVLSGGSVCQQWRVVLSDDLLWKPFFHLLNNGNKVDTSIPAKTLVKNNVISLKTKAKEQSLPGCMAHITLSRIGLSSLEIALIKAKELPEDNRATNFFTKSLSIKLIGDLYITENRLEEATNCLREIPQNIVRDELAHKLMLRYLKMNNLQMAFSCLPFIYRNAIASFSSLNAFMQAAKEAKNIEIAFQALERFKFRGWNAIVRNFSNFLQKNNELDNREKLHSLYPQAISGATDIYDVICCISECDLPKAEEIAVNLLTDRKEALLAIMNWYCLRGDQEGISRIERLL